MRKLTQTERVILDLLRQGHRPKSHSAEGVSQLGNSSLASSEDQKGV
jgi:hypothetical protein